MSQGEDPGQYSASRPGPGDVAWSVLLNGVLVAAFVIGAIPIVAIAHGFIYWVSGGYLNAWSLP